MSSIKTRVEKLEAAQPEVSVEKTRYIFVGVRCATPEEKARGIKRVEVSRYEMTKRGARKL